MVSLAYVALWVFVFTLPWELLIVLPGVSIVSQAAGIVAAALAVLAIMISGRVRRWHGFHIAALCFVLWVGCSLVLFTVGGVPKKFYTWLQLFVVALMVWELAVSSRRVLGLMSAYVIGAYVAALDTILLYRREAGELRRFTAGGFDPNDLAMTLALALPMAWYLGITYRRPLARWVCRGYVPVGLVAIGLTGSRGGMVASMVALLVVPLSMTRLTPGRLATAIAMLAISGALVVAYIPEKIVQRLATTSSEVEDADFGGRFKLWRAGLNAFTQKPLAGYGAGGFKGAITPQLGSLAQVAHDSYISVLVEHGIVGFLLYATMILAVVRAALRLPRAERRFALVLLATLGTAMLPLTWEDRKPVWFILAAVLGLSQAHAAIGAGALQLRRPGRPIHAPSRPVAAGWVEPQAAPGLTAHRRRGGGSTS
jgi:O-antigen ligase/polysaccharide polymerase Wzy-like membrane protein